jgi:DNA-binding MarR family transcriptional regulator
MTENPTPRPSFGRVLAETARNLGKLHRRALADFDSDFPSWMLLTLLAEQTPAIPVDHVVAEMDRRMDLRQPDVISLLERTAAAGFVAYHPEEPAPTAGLTEAGSAHYASLYAHARKLTDAAADGIDPEELDAAVTVLLAIDDRATALLGS